MDLSTISLIHDSSKNWKIYYTEAKPKRGYRHTRGDFWIFLYQSTIDTDSGLASVAEDREKSELGNYCKR